MIKFYTILHKTKKRVHNLKQQPAADALNRSCDLCCSHLARKTQTKKTTQT